MDRYSLTSEQVQTVSAVKAARNMPEACVKDAEEIVWAMGVVGLEHKGRGDTAGGCGFAEAVEERVRRLEQAECRFGWFSRSWDEDTMRLLISKWHEGSLVVDPALCARDGKPIVWMREYFAGIYPRPENQTDEWKALETAMFVLLARSLCRAYPAATQQGLVSFSDMQDFDWDIYDADTKRRHADIGYLIPHKLVRMITFHADDKMRGFVDSMGKRTAAKYGFVNYATFEGAVKGEASLLPDRIPTFVGGTHRCDIKACLTALFEREPEAQSLMETVYTSMKENGELPSPLHMA
eukprot:TRINITY_DN9508_c0_g1_i1.p1 TRINITY_DN9508_c0_g1~~TRINITY_DN9508_c0_g1_i1.p1  ORF type:complete len:295 (+),score=34.48 TRINITY_DN9508_c0_g1_i1:92-976(+)